MFKLKKKIVFVHRTLLVSYCVRKVSFPALSVYSKQKISFISRAERRILRDYTSVNLRLLKMWTIFFFEIRTICKRMSYISVSIFLLYCPIRLRIDILFNRFIHFNYFASVSMYFYSFLRLLVWICQFISVIQSSLIRRLLKFSLSVITDKKCIRFN